MAENNKSVNLVRLNVNCRCHVCAFFHGRDVDPPPDEPLRIRGGAAAPALTGV
jgi:hypothetical protein